MKKEKMELQETIKKRRSVRRFDNKKKVTHNQINKLLEAVRLAPSAGNLQSRFIFVAQKPNIKRKLMLAAFGQIWVAKAPVVFVFCADLKKIRLYGQRGKELYTIQDATIAAQNVWLTATAMGLGAVWVGAFREKAVKRILKMENHLKPIALMPLGYPKKIPSPKTRKPLEEIFKKI